MFTGLWVFVGDVRGGLGVHGGGCLWGGCSWGGVRGGGGCSWVVRSLGKLVQREDLEGRDGGGGRGGDSQDGWFPTVCIAAIPSSSTVSTCVFLYVFNVFARAFGSSNYFVLFVQYGGG